MSETEPRSASLATPSVQTCQTVNSLQAREVSALAMLDSVPTGFAGSGLACKDLMVEQV